MTDSKQSTIKSKTMTTEEATTTTRADASHAETSTSTTTSKKRAKPESASNLSANSTSSTPTVGTLGLENPADSFQRMLDRWTQELEEWRRKHESIGARSDSSKQAQQTAIQTQLQ
jgi:hypothetical protein